MFLGVDFMWAEIPWIALFTCVLAVVQLQFKYCVPCMLTTLKVVEAGLAVALFRAWVHRDELEVLSSNDIAAYVQDFASALKNRTEL